MAIRIHHPRHGFHNVMSESDVEAHAKHGWSKCATVKELTLAEKYEAKFGKKPHHMMKPENIQKALDDDSK